MQDIDRVAVKSKDKEFLGLGPENIIGIMLPVSVQLTIWQDAGGYHGLSLEMSEAVARELLKEVRGCFMAFASGKDMP